ncbi:DNA internalization-related competence protein ComEC/Rec2 [Lysobacter sp. S4-A87]|uniref:DNA internalization-related competence protein ComEC/Rec2 n=1 Tax=Lysobacter sp. S4-A87 TaxID=2925843 RepID=UPI001F53BF8A|nr:DNA internalization-related competence protein ComEC/Rec2 [Lysobacter sp. S4-A87]UNK49642.1 DNA internalization-related competence protein ComEC/Rec2 [Lysobacter sp. S4-A87]
MHEAARTPPFATTTALALLGGVCACLWMPWLLPWPGSVGLMLIGIALGWRGLRRRHTASLVIAWALLGFGLAGLHAAHALALQLPPGLEQRDARVSGRVVDLPVHEAARTRFAFRVDDDATQAEPLRGRTLRLAWYDRHAKARSGLRAGQRWQFDVRLRAPRGLRNPGGFDSERHAMAQRIAATGYLRQLEQARLLAPATGLEAWREAMSERIGQLQRPSARFVRALALGDTRALDDDDWHVLRANGLTHLIAISGFHVGLVAGFLALLVRALWWLWPMALARRMPAQIAAAAGGLCGAVLYAAAVGFALPTVRTALMIAVVAGVRMFRRPLKLADSLALAAFAVLLIDPLAVLGAGFWLSYAGVAWLLWCLPRGSKRPLHDFLSAQGVATVGLLPLSAVLFGQASLAGLLANLVAVPLWSLVVVPLSLLGLALEMASPGAGAWMWKLASMAFDLAWPWFERLAASPLAVWWLPEARWFALPLALIGAFWLLLPRDVPGKPLALLLLLPLLWPDRDLPRHGEAGLVVIDVGQGLSVQVRTARHVLLYDMGPAVRDGFDAGERAVVPALQALGVRRLDRLVVSHADNDHAGGLDAVGRAFGLDRLWAPDGAPMAGARPCVAGQAWDWDGVRFRFLHPPPHFPYLGNEASCVLRIEAAGASALLTGDIGEVVERILLRRDPLAVRADVVTVPHHGSDGSSDPGFVAATGAGHALVSSGHGNRFGHPRSAIVRRWAQAGAQVHDTAGAGALRVRLGRGGVSVESRRQAQPRLWDAARRWEKGAAGLSYQPD